ncbi:MAG TPA: hypothetical protein IGS52_24175 [Oscillatoriaceae cyanobacterium M33_DOE_052]|uniref:Hydrogenase n=1 Tax=Planktothricoides sp. SpSt-374 TaxID=2282167 RepID=A0A7C3ZVF8_9CYAN|nr:hypothetical protein [Oscillatoriaceae cyanobacterium M33_DOE_052]
MTENNPNLRQKLAALLERSPGLGSRLAQAAIELKEAGVPPAELLIEQLTAYRQEFASLRAEAIAAAKAVSSEQLPPQVTSLKDIERLLAIAATPKVGGVREGALEVLDLVLSIIHTDQPDFPHLQSVQAQALTLRQQIAQAPPDALPPEAEALHSRRHTLCALLALVDPPADLNDEKWGVLVEVVTRAYNKAITVAAARGKLVYKKSPAPPAPSTPPVKEAQRAMSDFPEVMVIGAQTAKPSPSSVLKPPSAPTQPEEDVIIIPGSEEVRGTQSDGERLIFGAVPLARSGGEEKPALGLKVLVSVERFGDRVFKGGEFAGTKGKALRVEGFSLNLEPPVPGLGLRYMACLEGIGDTPWVMDGEFIGSRGSGKRLEGFAVELTGNLAANYDVFYTAHIQNIGDTPTCSNGKFCGTRSGLRVEAMRVWIQQK